MLCVGTSLGARTGFGLAVGCITEASADAESLLMQVASSVSRSLLADQVEPRHKREDRTGGGGRVYGE